MHSLMSHTVLSFAHLFPFLHICPSSVQPFWKWGRTNLICWTKFSQPLTLFTNQVPAQSKLNTVSSWIPLHNLCSSFKSHNSVPAGCQQFLAHHQSLMRHTVLLISMNSMLWDRCYAVFGGDWSQPYERKFSYQCHCKVSSYPLNSTRNTTKGPGAQNVLTRPNEFHAAR